MRIYLDTCSIQRPLDTKSHPRIALEAEAVLVIVSLCQSNNVELVSSDALLYEARRCSLVARQKYAWGVLSTASKHVQITPAIEQRAREFNALGIHPLDALHLALAEEAQADYLCTCDDQFLRKAQSISGMRTRVVSPVALTQEIGTW